MTGGAGDHGGDQRGRGVAMRDWVRFDRPSTDPWVTWPLDVGFVLAAVAGVLTEQVVLWVHMIFALLAIAALMLPFRRFVVRLATWMSVATALVIWAINTLSVPSDELKELPLLTFVLVLVFLVAQARDRAASGRESAHQEINIRAEAERDGLRHQLEQAQRLEMLGRTSTSLAHDLRNVFVVIRGCAADADRADENDIRSCLGDVLGATDRGTAIIDSFLWMGRQHEHDLAGVDLAAAVRQSEPLLRRLTKARTTVEVVVPDDSVVLAKVDRISLTQILMNLVANADDAIDGSGTITVTAGSVNVQRPGEQVQRFATIVVSDTGAGFTTEAMARAFEPEFTTKPQDHSGLGLATVWQLVDMFNGSIELESSPAGGARVTVRLAIVDDTPGGITDEHESPAPQENESASQPGQMAS